MKKILFAAFAAFTALAHVSCGSDNAAYYYVYFNSEGGSAVASQLVGERALATRPDDPTRAGYSFAGWFREATGTSQWDFGTDRVSSHTTLHAHWSGMNYAGINTLISEVEKLSSANYTSSSWALLQNALFVAKAVAANPTATDAQINEAVAALQNARNNLVNVGDLKAAILAAQALPSGAYTSNSWNMLQQAIASAQTVSNNTDATQAQVSDAFTGLKGAIDGLVLDTSNGGTTSVADKGALKTSIANADGKTKGDYTDDSWNAMQTALTEAKNVAANPAASQAQVDAARSNLDRAVAALQHSTVTDSSADKSALNSFITDSEKLKQADYTADSWSVFQNALTNAKAVSANSSATQQEIDQAYQTLEAAVNNLVLTQADTGVVSGLVNELTSLVNSLPSADAVKQNPLLAAVTIPTATLADQVRDQLMNLLGNNNDPQVADLNSTLNGLLGALGLGNLI